MGRYSSDPAVNAPVSNQPQVPTNTYVSSNPYSNNPYGMMQSGQPNQQMVNPMIGWPTVFNKPVIGLDLHGTLIEYVENIRDISQVVPIPGALEAVRMLRLKGHRVMIITDFPGISKGASTQQQADAIIQNLMNLLGQAGCMSIDGVLYCTTEMKEDIFSKQNNGMFKKATDEQKVDWKKGWYVGDAIEDLKAADRVGSRPILVMTGKGQEALSKLETFANRELKKKVKIYSNLLAFAQSI